MMKVAVGFRLFFWSIALLGVACSPARKSLDIELSALRSDVHNLRIALSAASLSRDWGSVTQPGSPLRFTLRLPDDASGLVQVRVSGVDARGCFVNNGSATVDLDSPPSGPLGITTDDVHESACAIIVQVGGTGSGTLEAKPCTMSASAGLSYRVGLAADELLWDEAAQRNKQVTLVANPDEHSYFIGWSDPSGQSDQCSGLGACQLSFSAEGHRVVATFALRTSCTADGFCWQNPLPQGFDLRRVFGFSSQQVWAVGAGGTVLYYNGSLWSAVASASTETLRSVWGSRPEDIWIVGEHGTILHFDGVKLEPVPLAAPTKQSLTAVWGSSSDNIWIAGTGGTLLHYDGKGLAAVTPPTSADLNAIWGNGPDDIWFAGAKGTVLHYDGHAVTRVAVPTTSDLYSVWGYTSLISGSRQGEVWLGGDTTLLVSTGGDFHDGAGPLPGIVHELWGLPPAAPDQPFAVVWAAGTAGVLRRSGSARWEPLYPATPNELYGLWGSQPGDLWGVGAAGALVHWNGALFTSATSGTRSLALSMWGSGPQDVWLADDDAHLLHFNGTGWSLVKNRDEGLINGIFGFGARDIWAVGDDTLFWHFDGNTWTYAAQLTGTDAESSLNSVWGAASDDLWAVGDLGTIIHYRGGGKSPTKEPPVTLSPLYHVWGSAAQDIWAVGALGTILHYDGTTWAVQPRATNLALFGLWGSSATDVWAVGEGGVILRWHGTSWEPLPVDFGCTQNLNLFSVWGSAPDDVWLAGATATESDCATLLHWDGRQLNPMRGLPHSLTAIWGTPPSSGQKGQIFVAGREGIILNQSYGDGK